MGPAIAIGAGIILLGLLLFRSKSASPIRQLPESSTPQPPPQITIDDKEIEEILKEEEKDNTLNISEIKSPSPSVINNEQWRKYVKVSITAKPGTISKGYNLGMFLINMRTLEDYGYVKNTKKQSDGTWRGEWVSPYSLEKFLGNPKLQYEVFEKMTINHAKAINARHASDIGKDIEGKKITASGLLGVSKQAGLGGLAKWLKETPGERKDNTTKAFLRTNGIF